MPDAGTDLLVSGRAAPKWPTVVMIAAASVTLGIVLLSLWRIQTEVAPSPTAQPYTVATARAGVVGQSAAIRAEVRWGRAPVARNLVTGTVTSVALEDTAMAHNGQELYSVDLRPVHVAAGSTPAFRDLEEGMTGPDVRQLQAMLAVQGWLRSSPDGIFGPSTKSAVRNWQLSDGEKATGAVARGRVLFVPTLPARLSLDRQSVSVGALLAGNEPAVIELATDPQIEAALSADLLARVQDGARSTLAAEGSTWTGVIRSTEVGQDGTGKAVLGQKDGSSCGEQCPFVPGSEDSVQVRGEVVLVPRTQGTVVPVAAIRSAGTDRYVVDARGHRHPVTILASASGRAVVDGIEPRMRVRISAETSE
ncbi:peptidoglycan-binding protein [Curtobacterium sp. AB7]|uniref:peptidoglycan-binding protein n=1 Tax=Curtobacterium sp. AB7 TaxID=3349327 RepID=UPI003833DE43